MSKIYGHLVLPASSWRYVFHSVLKFFNEEIESAHKEATDFYEANKQLPFADIEAAFNSLSIALTPYRESFIRSALFSGTNQKMYKPKNNNFRKLTNRTKSINAENLSVEFQKSSHELYFTLSDVDELEDCIKNDRFLSEFITMVNTIDWPGRAGPNKTVRGCTLINETTPSAGVVFYQVGPNPPEHNSAIHINTVVEEPEFLTSTIAKNITLVSSTLDENSQPLPPLIDISEF